MRVSVAREKTLRYGEHFQHLPKKKGFGETKKKKLLSIVSLFD